MESSAFTPVTLNSSSQGTVSLKFLHTGDYVVAENLLSSPTRWAYSAPITITTAAKPTIIVSAPGTAQEASAGAGVTISETISTVNLAGPIYAAVYTASGVMESSAFTPVTLNSSSQGTVSLKFLHTGDYVVAENLLSSPTRWAYSAQVTITDPAALASSASTFLISSVVPDSSRLLVSGDKEIGADATVREFMDGKYLGVIHDLMPDGLFSFHIPDVTAGAHELVLTLDGYTKSAIYDFTRTIAPTASAAGTVTTTIHAASSGSATALLASIGVSSHTVTPILST